MCNLHWCYTFCTGVTLFALVLNLNCTALSQSESSNFFTYIINTLITRALMAFSRNVLHNLKFLKFCTLKLNLQAPTCSKRQPVTYFSQSVDKLLIMMKLFSPSVTQRKHYFILLLYGYNVISNRNLKITRAITP